MPYRTPHALPLLLVLAPLTSTCGSTGSGTVNDRNPHDGETAPPVALVEPTRLEAHGDVRVDDYYWMRDREDPRVIAHLEAENAYFDAQMAPLEALREELYQEFVARIQEDDETVPVPDGPFEYFSRTFAGKSYPSHYRRERGAAAGTEQLLFDVNALAEGHGYFALSSRTPSPSHEKIAYAIDTVGRRIYDIEIKNIVRGDIERSISGASGNMAWSGDGNHLYYVKRDPVTLRAYQVWKHQLERPQSMDELVYEEADEEFSVYLSPTRSERFLRLVCNQTLTTETRVLDLADPDAEWRVVLPRETGHEYDVDHGVFDGEDRFVIRTNKDAENFRIVTAPIDAPGDWTPTIPHRLDTLVSSVSVFATHLVTRERHGGLGRIAVYPLAADEFEPFELPFEDPAYRVGLSGNRDFDTRRVRYSYSSLTTPDSTFEYDLDSGETELLKQEEVGGGFSPADYTSERVFAVAPDGASVPISLVYRRDRPAGPGPLLLYGYGSYGASMDASFNSNVVSLLDRGYAYAIAHIRGGQELGRAWYEHGKLQRKMNTFSDFIACAEHLVDRGLTEPKQLYAMGGSAGGLLIGAVANMRPSLFHGLIAAVPFVDVVTTMLDDTIPLTTFEYDEWGNPNIEADYRYMLSYSPYDQVKAQAYPHMLVTTGLHDSQVQYWEPAKWVAKLRAVRSGGGRLLFHCEMEAGHGGVSGRYGRLREVARNYAFLLSLSEH